jgi:hypothetical protein
VTDLFDAEHFTERAAIREFDGCQSREEAEAAAMVEVEAHRHACEARYVARMRSNRCGNTEVAKCACERCKSERNAFMAIVLEKRGKAAHDRLKSAVIEEFRK